LFTKNLSYGSVTRASHSSQAAIEAPFIQHWVPPQRQEMLLGTSTDTAVPGICHRHKSNGDTFTKRQDPGDTFTKRQDPGDSFTKRQDPGDSFTKRQDPGDTFTKRQDPEDSEGHDDCPMSVPFEYTEASSDCRPPPVNDNSGVPSQTPTPGN
jgi:hypothetical protein